MTDCDERSASAGGSVTSDVARWMDVKETVARALDLPRSERPAFVRRATNGDPELLEEVESLLAVHETMDETFLVEPALPAAEPMLLEVPERVGTYRVVRRLGEGGMGTVLLAESPGPIERRVAIKLIHGGLLDVQARYRFEMECRALSRMNHPNIAQVYEAGTTDRGLPYIVMEHVPGLPVTRFCDARSLDLRQRLEIFVQIGEGIQHAHRAGVIHRDVKPSNVLVGDDRVPKVIDFGIAKSLEQSGGLEATGSLMVGTLPYMSPEMLGAGDVSPAIDTRCDVYALGVLLYELLVGRHPFGGAGSGLMEIVRLKTGDRTPAPSTLYRGLDREQRRSQAVTRRTTEKQLERRLRGDLDCIARTAVAELREDRYGTAAELVADVRRHLEDRPVLARPESRAYLLRKLVRRHRVPAIAALLLVASLIAGLTGMTLQAERASRESRAAQAARAEAEQVAGFLVDLFESADPASSQGASVTARELLDRGAREIEAGLDDQPLVRARLMDTIGVVYLKLGLASAAESLLEEALAERERHGAPQHAIAWSLLHLANVYAERARYEEAERACQRALELARESSDLGEGFTVAIRNELGRIARFRGQYAQSEAHYRRALDLGQRILGAEHATVATSLNGLAVLYSQTGRLPEAEDLYRRALSIHEQLGHAEDPRVATTIDNLAVVLSMQGHVDEAEPLFRRALGIRQRILGEDHLAVALSLNNLANLMVLEERRRNAAPLYRRALEIKTARLGEDHPEVAKALHNLGECLAELGDSAAALPLLERALSIWDRRSPQSRYAAHTAHKLANVYRDLGRYASARELYERSLRDYAGEPILEPGHIEETEEDYRRMLESLRE